MFQLINDKTVFLPLLEKLAKQDETVVRDQAAKSLTTISSTLNDAEIPVQMVATGDMRVSVLMPARFGREAVRKIHQRFNLEEGTITV